jgi:hypothetical protein
LRTAASRTARSNSARCGVAQFRNPLPNVAAYIGAGLRSQHWYANYAHVLYLNSEGRIIITEPDEEPPTFYKDHPLRDPTKIDLRADHAFRIRFDEGVLRIKRQARLAYREPLLFGPCC